MPVNETPTSSAEDSTDEQDTGDLNDLLQELRILLPGAQVLTAFLTILPFNNGFAEIDALEKWIYLITYCCAITSLVLFSTPAMSHRLERPLQDREEFKRYATRIVIAGAVPLSIALVLVSQLVIAQVFSSMEGTVVAAGVAVLIGVLWWLLPFRRKQTK